MSWVSGQPGGLHRPLTLIISALTLVSLTGSHGFLTSAFAQELPPVAEPDVCYECHDRAGLTGRRHVHGALEGGKCSQCHNPHAARHATLLRDEPSHLCFGCHDDVKDAVGRANPHQPAAGGECTTCHQPHASDFRGLLRSDGVSLCSSCHGQVAEWRDRRVGHPPFLEGDCATCHEAHGSTARGLLTEAMPDLCMTCHEADAAFRSAHSDFDPERARCSVCHDPHASDVPKLVMGNQHAPFREGKCNMCHTGGRAMELRGQVKELCRRCHSVAREWEGMAFHHVLDDETSCVHCHNPHAAGEEKLLSARQVNLCLTCHGQDAGAAAPAGAARPTVPFITHEGLNCTECHAVHGADNGKYLKGDGLKTCTSCHVERHKASHPMGEGTTDPRNGSALNCISCHQLHKAPFEKYLPLDPQGDLCIQCHQR